MKVLTSLTCTEVPRNFLENNKRAGPKLFLSSGVNLFQSKATSVGNQCKSEEHIQIKWVHKLALTFHKKGWKTDAGNYRPVSLTSVPNKIMEQFILSAFTGHVKDNQGIRPS